MAKMTELLEVDYPITHLFDAIFRLQHYPGLEDEIEMLSTTLADFFDLLPDKSGRKIFNRNHVYYTTGLCTYNYRSIVLRPWVSEKELKVVERKEIREWSTYPVSYYSDFWSDQVSVHAGKRIEYLHNSSSIHDAISAYVAYSKIHGSKEEKSIDLKPMIRAILSACSSTARYFGPALQLNKLIAIPKKDLDILASSCSNRVRKEDTYDYFASLLEDNGCKFPPMNQLNRFYNTPFTPDDIDSAAKWMQNVLEICLNVTDPAIFSILRKAGFIPKGTRIKKPKP